MVIINHTKLIERNKMHKVNYYLQYILVPALFLVVLIKNIGKAVVYSYFDLKESILEHKRAFGITRR